MTNAKKTALIIEDDPDASDILAELMRERDFEPVQCMTGEDGLNRARKENPTIVFLDLMLPDLDGYKVCEALKLDRDTNAIPVVMVTALTADKNRVQGFRVGADAYVSKPYTPEDLDDAIERAHQHKQTVEESKYSFHVNFDLASEIPNLQSVNELFGMILRHSRLREKEIGQLRTALVEIGSNAIEWGNKHDPDKVVRISARIEKSRIEIQIEDEGEGFDPENLPHAFNGGEDPTSHFSVRNLLGMREGGFGILIAKGMVDDVRYNDSGTSVTLVKYLS